MDDTGKQHQGRQDAMIVQSHPVETQTPQSLLLFHQSDITNCNVYLQPQSTFKYHQQVVRSRQHFPRYIILCRNFPGTVINAVKKQRIAYKTLQLCCKTSDHFIKLPKLSIKLQHIKQVSKNVTNV